MAGVSESAVVAEEEDLLAPGADGDEWAAEVDAVLVAVLDGLGGLAGGGIVLAGPKNPQVSRAVLRKNS